MSCVPRCRPCSRSGSQLLPPLLPAWKPRLCGSLQLWLGRTVGFLAWQSQGSPVTCFVGEPVLGILVLLCLSVWGDLGPCRTCAHHDTFESGEGAKGQTHAHCSRQERSLWLPHPEAQVGVGGTPLCWSLLWRVFRAASVPPPPGACLLQGISSQREKQGGRTPTHPSSLDLGETVYWGWGTA